MYQGQKRKRSDSIDEVINMLNAESAIAQLEGSSSNSSFRKKLIAFFSNPEYTSLDITNKVIVGGLCAGGAYADVYDGKLLTTDESIIRQKSRNKNRLRVYIERNPSTFKKVAVKRLRYFMFLDDNGARSLSRELRVWSDLEHPNVLRLLGFALVDALPAFISEWMENGTLTGYIKQNSQFGLKSMVLQIAKGLGYLHEKGVVHGDLKPDNILVSHDGRPLLSDFGVSRIVIESATITGTASLKGNLRYMAPELLKPQAGLKHEFHTKESDVWAFGMVVYEMSTGNIPYHHLTLDTQVVNYITSELIPPRPVTSIHEDFEEMWYICQKCWLINPSSRATCSQLITILETPLPPDLLNPTKVPAESQKKGSDWLVVYNPNVPKKMDVELLHTLDHDENMYCARFSSDGKYIAAAGRTRVHVYDSSSGGLVCVLNIYEASSQSILRVWSVCFSPDGKHLATAGRDSIVQIWDVAKRRIHHKLEGHTASINSLSFSSDGRFIVSGCLDETARIWDMDSDNVRVLSTTPRYGPDASVRSIAISPDMKLVVGGCDDKIVRIWDANTGDLVDILKGHTGDVNSVAFTPDGMRLVCGSDDRTIKHWDLSGLLHRRASGAPLSTSSLEDSHLPSTTSPNPSPLECAASGTSNPSDATPNFNGDSEVESICALNFTGHKNLVQSVAVSPDGQWIVSGSWDRDVRVWDSSTAELLMLLRGHQNNIWSVDINATGDVLATASEDRRVRLWRISRL